MESNKKPAINTKFCTSCQCYRDIDGGVNRRFRTTARWLCHSCVTHKSHSIYRNTSGRVANVQLIMKTLYAAQAAKEQG
jgi:hypothetical protein